MREAMNAAVAKVLKRGGQTPAQQFYSLAA
jgi:hypothetical protein